MTVSESERFSRQLLFWGEAFQQRIALGSLLIAGLGGLGATVSQIMARAGVARLYLVDDGLIEWSDLHRQSLYAECDVGRKKAEVAKERLSLINSGMEIITSDKRIDDAWLIPDGINCVVDCLDTFASRFVLYNAMSAGCFFVHGGVYGDQGQILTLVKGRSQTLEMIMAGCSQPDGIIPATPDSVFIIAGMMANEVLHTLAGSPRLLDRFLVVSLADFNCSYLDVSFSR
jgi:molybdopterin synthase catalytic subunit